MVKKKRVSASEKEYNRLAKNVNAKIKRVRENYNLDLTYEIPIPKFSDLNTKERKAQKELMKSFTNRSNLRYQFEKNAYGLVKDKKFLKELTRNTETSQRKSAEYLKEMGEITGKNIGKMKTSEIVEKYSGKSVSGVGIPSTFDFNKFSTYRALEERFNKMKERSTKEYYTQKGINYQQNFIDKLSDAFNSEADDLIDKIKTLTPNQFYELTKKHDIDFDFFYLNELLTSDDAIELRRINNAVNSYMKSKNINYLKVV